MIFIYNLSTQKYTEILLRYAFEHDMVNRADVLSDTMRKTKTSILQLHNHNIYQRKDGRWVSKLGVGKSAKLIVRKDKSDLEDAIIQYILLNEQMEFSFDECFQKWLQEEENSSNPSICPKSITNYRAEYKRFLEGNPFCSKRMLDITENDIRRLLKDILNRPIRISRKRFNSCKSLITRTFDFARITLEFEGLIPIRHIMKEMVFNPSQFSQPKQTQQVFVQSDLKTLFNHLHEENTLISLGILLTAQTGLRVSEISALCWDDVQEDYLHICHAEHSWTASNGERHIQIGAPKEGKTRNVILSDEAKGILAKIHVLHPTHTGYVILNGNTRATCRMFDYYIRKYCRECNIPVLSMHKLRKTYTSVLLASGIPEKVVQTQLGHSDISTTQQSYNYNFYVINEQVGLLKGSNVMLTPVNPSSKEMKKAPNTDFINV